MAKGKLEETLERLARRRRERTPQASPISLSPGCAYGVRYAQLLEDLQKDVAEVKARLNGLLFLLAGTVALDIVLKLIR
ncbi:MAG: hypothetical protein Q8P59_03020 [Dehalococcoidia bacterium]|nr:hypothetical protein [Dehalococcoidia bacterium]